MKQKILYWKEFIGQWITQLGLTTREVKWMGVIIVSSMILGSLIYIRDNPQDLECLLRNTYGGGSKSETLNVYFGESGEKRTVEVEVGEQLYTQDEVRQKQEEAIQVLDTVILGENVSFDRVDQPLNLVSELVGLPFEVVWKWSPYQALDKDGTPDDDHVESEGTLVELTAMLYYAESEAQYSRTVRVYPLDRGEEQGIFLLQEQIKEKEESTDTESTLLLPSEWEEENLTWSYSTQWRGVVIASFGMFTAVMIWYKKKMDEKKQKSKRDNMLILDYPEIVNRLLLLIGAGMTTKSAWVRIVEMYESEERIRPAYEEMRVTHNEMKNGISEVEAYDRFGNRCQLGSYRKLGHVLGQCVKKGAKGVYTLLEAEAREANEERKARARQLGEKAGTKLLMPMLLMLMIVLVVVILPTFLTM